MLARKVIDIVNNGTFTSNVMSVTPSLSSFGYYSHQLNYTTNIKNEWVGFEINMIDNENIQGVYVAFPNITYIKIFESVSYIYYLDISYGYAYYKQLYKPTGVITTYKTIKFTNRSGNIITPYDIYVCMKKEIVDGYIKKEFYVATGDITNAFNDIEPVNELFFSSYGSGFKFSIGRLISSPSTSNLSLYGMGIAYDTDDLARGSEIDLTLDKEPLYYLDENCNPIRILTENDIKNKDSLNMEGYSLNIGDTQILTEENLIKG